MREKVKKRRKKVKKTDLSNKRARDLQSKWYEMLVENKVTQDETLAILCSAFDDFIKFHHAPIQVFFNGHLVVPGYCDPKKDE